MDFFWMLAIVAGFVFIGYKVYQMRTRVRPVKPAPPLPEHLANVVSNFSNSAPTGTRRD